MIISYGNSFVKFATHCFPSMFSFQLHLLFNTLVGFQFFKFTAHLPVLNIPNSNLLPLALVQVSPLSCSRVKKILIPFVMFGNWKSVGINKLWKVSV